VGRTEIELLVTPDDVDGLHFPTTRLHALAAVDAALEGPARCLCRSPALTWERLGRRFAHVGQPVGLNLCFRSGSPRLVHQAEDRVGYAELS
jgi:hypothetical protein